MKKYGSRIESLQQCEAVVKSLRVFSDYKWCIKKWIKIANTIKPVTPPTKRLNFPGTTAAACSSTHAFGWSPIFSQARCRRASAQKRDLWARLKSISWSPVNPRRLPLPPRLCPLVFQSPIYFPFIAQQTSINPDWASLCHQPSPLCKNRRSLLRYFQSRNSNPQMYWSLRLFIYPWWLYVVTVQQSWSSDCWWLAFDRRGWTARSFSLLVFVCFCVIRQMLSLWYGSSSLYPASCFMICWIAS